MVTAFLTLSLLALLSSMPRVLLSHWCFLRLGFTFQINYLQTTLSQSPLLGRPKPRQLSFFFSPNETFFIILTDCEKGENKVSKIKAIVFLWTFRKDEIKRSLILTSMTGFSFQSAMTDDKELRAYSRNN